MPAFIKFVIALALLWPGLPAGEADDESSISHLPDVLQRDIAAWRQRLANACCLKVVCETDETWATLHDLDADGCPKVVARERFSVHSWMTPDSVWVVVFPYNGDEVETTRPIFQQFWSAQTGKVWERTWKADTVSYQVRSYECKDAFGPTNPNFGSRGCTFATVTESWIAGPADLSKRSRTVASVSLLRRPNLAMVPPDPTQRGVWLDVFWETVQRNQDTDPNSLYRRHDFMLLARNDAGEPELREWRTLVATDPTDRGKRPQQITAIRRLSYAFHDAAPAELKAATEAFVADVERAIGN